MPKGIEGGYQPPLEEGAEIQPAPEDNAETIEKRLAGEALLLRGGAVYARTEKGDLRLELTPQQIEENATKLKDIEFYSQVTGMSTKKVEKIFHKIDMQTLEQRTDREKTGHDYSGYDNYGRQVMLHGLAGELTSSEVLANIESHEEVTKIVDDFLTHSSEEFLKLPEHIASLEDPQLVRVLQQDYSNMKNSLPKIKERGIKCCLFDDIGMIHLEGKHFKDLPTKAKHGFYNGAIKALEFGLKHKEGKLEDILDGQSVLRFLSENIAQENGLRVGDVFRELLVRIRAE